MECKLSESFSPMNTNASKVEDINILQIIERLSMSCIASSGERSNIFRTRLFTLFKNDRDLRERFESVAVSESISSSMTNLSDTGLPVLVCCTFNELRDTFRLSDLGFHQALRCNRGKHVRMPHTMS